MIQTNTIRGYLCEPSFLYSISNGNWLVHTHHLNHGGGGCSGGINGSGSHMFEISSIEQKQKLWHNLCIEFPTELIPIVCIKENFISN